MWNTCFRYRRVNIYHRTKTPNFVMPNFTVAAGGRVIYYITIRRDRVLYIIILSYRYYVCGIMHLFRVKGYNILYNIYGLCKQTIITLLGGRRRFGGVVVAVAGYLTILTSHHTGVI